MPSNLLQNNGQEQPRYGRKNILPSECAECHFIDCFSLIMLRRTGFACLSAYNKLDVTQCLESTPYNAWKWGGMRTSEHSLTIPEIDGY
ncbi:MAG: hypothetical protein IT525_11860 [Nitrosomonas sp.]|nr:hypothetical protein [Nitrosomonas sp.]